MDAHLPPALAAALADARTLAAERGWRLPDEATLGEARALLTLAADAGWRAPSSVQAEPDGAIALEWEAGAHGWLRLEVRGTGQVTHAAVIDGDEYGLAEPFAGALPPWVAELLKRLLAAGH